jgi:hypothetical protein
VIATSHRRLASTGRRAATRRERQDRRKADTHRSTWLTVTSGRWVAIAPRCQSGHCPAEASSLSRDRLLDPAIRIPCVVGAVATLGQTLTLCRAASWPRLRRRLRAAAFRAPPTRCS